MAANDFHKQEELPVDTTFWVITFWVATCIIIALLTTLGVIISY